MNTQEKYNLLVNRFEAAANPKDAEAMSAYLRHQFSFFGVRTPARRLLYKDIIAADKKAKFLDWDLLDLAWNLPHRELDYFVCDYLKSQQTLLTFDDIPKLLTYATSHQWWDSIDSLDRIFGNIVDDRIRDLMLEFAQSEDFWLCRLAIDHQLGRKEKTDTDLLEKIILLNLGSKEFFINKSIGWALRDYSKVNPNWVRTFLQQHKEKLAPLSIKEASKYI
ncbi:DNA alkylation repair protein [Streptococcus gallolyticus]|uniref:DNA alkylation repair protein n=1 Tax=Streptococcus hepaticus TaxID=3349163 RepID=UPI001C94BE2C|nr:DNA alkylation repair protein [Streptococcus gallolyticus]MBY5040561.1 DNA alkylation repair protein [Streptococcus gallolyticus]